MAGGPPWNELLDAQLLELWRNGTRKQALAMRFARTAYSIQTRLHDLRKKLGAEAVPYQNEQHRPFTDAEDRVVIALYNAGARFDDILEKLPGRSYEMLKNRVDKLRAKKKLGYRRKPVAKPAPKTPDPDAEIALLESEAKLALKKSADALGAALAASGRGYTDARNARTGLGGYPGVTRAPTVRTLGGIGSAML